MIGERDAGWLTHASDELPGKLIEHPAVVLREMLGGAFLVIHGTTTPRDTKGNNIDTTSVPTEPNDTCYWVDPDTRAGRALELTARTFFHRRAVDVAPANRIRVVGVCPPDVFLRLRKIAGFTG